MPYSTPLQRTHQRRRRLCLALALCIGAGILTVLDRDLFHTLRIPDWETHWRNRDWVLLLRSMGYLPTWIAIALITQLIQLDSRRPSPTLPHIDTTPRTLRNFLPRQIPRHAGTLILLSAAAAGILAELLKILIRRHRPSDDNLGAYAFDWLQGPLPGRGLGLASSHAAVAFGAAFLICKLSPRAGLLAITLAIGCALTRLFAGAHFATDTYAAAILGALAAAIVWRISKNTVQNPVPPVLPKSLL